MYLVYGCIVGSRSLCEVCANSWRCRFTTGFVQHGDELIIVVCWVQTSDVEEITLLKCACSLKMCVHAREFYI
jgi:hypothetical protein